MPNGGSDCCGTCWFNARNNGEAGYGHADSSEPDHCTIRNLSINAPFYTYCGNHPHRRPEKDPIPLGPVYTGDSTGHRKLWEASPDTEEIRQHLLSLVEQMWEKPSTDYPLGSSSEEIVAWQLGEFRETRAVAALRRIAARNPARADKGPFGRTREGLVEAAKEALGKIGRVS